MLYGNYGEIMAQLQIKDVPEDVYEALSRAALMENRSVVQQAVVLLRSALSMREELTIRRRSVFKEINDLHIKNTGKFPAPAELIREAQEG
jgi:plasmid stability protein